MKIRKYFSFVLILAMLCSVIPAQAFAFTNGDSSAFAIPEVTVELDGTLDGEAIVSLVSTAQDTYMLLEGYFGTADTTGKLQLVSMEAGYVTGSNDSYVDAEEGKFTYLDGNAVGTEFAKNAAIVTAKYKVPSDTPAGTYMVNVTNVQAADLSGNELQNASYTAYIKVTQKEVQADPNAYNVYYKFLDTAEDTAPADNFYEIDPGSTIDVQVWVSANSEKTMQAFDIYPLWDATVVGENRVLNVTKVTAAQGFEIVDEMDAAKPHFLTNITVDNGNIDKTVDQDGIHVATMTLSLSNDAEYGIHYPIWFGEDTNLSQTGTAESVETVNVQAQGEIGVETLKTYTVTYDANGGSFEGEAPTQKKQHNVELTLEPGKTPSRDGYTFQGWSTTSGDNNADDMITNYTANEATTLYAIWKANTHTVTWKSQDGSETLATSTVTHGEKPTYGGETPTKVVEGYTVTFAGWATEPNQTSGKPVTELTAVTTDGVVYYAAFTETINQYTITFENTGDTTINPITQDYSTAVTAPPDPEKEGYTFAGWDKKIPATMPAEDVTITAQWTINQYTITFNTDGGSAIEAIKQDYNTAVAAPTNPTKTGYNFVKWVDENGNEVTVPTTMPAENITLKAIWEAVTYNVTLNANGGTIADGKDITSYTYSPDTAVALPGAADMTKAHYTFAGWYANEAFEGTAVTEIPAGSTDDKTYWAKWNAVQYTITFDANGGTVTPASTTYTYDTTTLELPTPTYAFHKFDGWYVSETVGSWVKGSKFNMTQNSHGNVTVYAKWILDFSHVVEDYKYAPANYVMLRIETTAENTSAYKFGDIEMYYTADTDYLLNGNPVLVTLIPKKDGETDLIKKATSGDGYELTDAGLDKLSETDTGAREIVRDGKINMNDDIVNIADANAVYQMIVNESIGGYYSIDQLEIYNRLVADMSTEIGEKADHRGSIADVNAIVTIINNAANAN